jgi:PPK2 family polyphosphate:nucleotide phosphotransferase
MNIEKFKIGANPDFRLSDIPTDYTGKIKSEKEVQEHLAENIRLMEEFQGKLYAQDRYGILIILQAMDTAGKDGVIKHVMTGLNPQGTHVRSFKQPSAEELDHDYLWRANRHLPERGQIGIFNRSYYEEVLVVRVHNLIGTQHLPAEFVTEQIWENRFAQIRNFEAYLFENGIIPIKFFLHISKKEQRQRLLQRIEDPDKNWKFSEADIKERRYWEAYQYCYQEAIRATSTDTIPWYVIPSDHKWVARLLVSKVIVDTLQRLNLCYPVVNAEKKQMLQDCKLLLLNE